MSMKRWMEKRLDRRQFIKETGKATAVLAGLFGGLSGLNSGCATVSLSFNETRKDMANIKWDCNPVLPIPNEGCYTGTSRGAGGETEDRKAYDRRYTIEGFIRKYGITPSFSLVGGSMYSAFNNYFPLEECKTAISLGVIPIIRYITQPFSGYDEIANGKRDIEIQKFANQAAAFGNPIIFVPYPQLNILEPPESQWDDYSSNIYKDVWVRMHTLFSEEGANKNVIWASEFMIGRWNKFKFPDPFQYLPPEKYFDILGWICMDYHQPSPNKFYGQSMEALYDYYYLNARKKFPKKPQMIMKFSTNQGAHQAKWYEDALNNIKNKYFGLKGVIFDEYAYYNQSIRHYNPLHSEEIVQIIKKHFTDPYFIGSAINKRTS